jgi:hypothetical protein
LKRSKKALQPLEQATRGAEQSYSSAAGGFRDFNLRIMEMTQANALAGLEFAREMATAKGPNEALEVWSSIPKTIY